VLQIRGDVNAAPDVRRVVSFDDVLAAIIERAVASQKTEAAFSPKSVKDDGGLLSSLSLPVRRGVTVQRILIEDCRMMQST
jgi:hypothetical protein